MNFMTTLMSIGAMFEPTILLSADLELFLSEMATASDMPFGAQGQPFSVLWCHAQLISTHVVGSEGISVVLEFGIVCSSLVLAASYHFCSNGLLWAMPAFIPCCCSLEGPSQPFVTHSLVLLNLWWMDRNHCGMPLSKQSGAAHIVHFYSIFHFIDAALNSTQDLRAYLQ